VDWDVEVLKVAGERPGAAPLARQQRRGGRRAGAQGLLRARRRAGRRRLGGHAPAPGGSCALTALTGLH